MATINRNNEYANNHHETRFILTGECVELLHMQDIYGEIGEATQLIGSHMNFLLNRRMAGVFAGLPSG